MRTAPEDEAYGAIIMTTDKRVPYQVSLSEAETGATTWRIADTVHGVNQLDRVICGITLKDKMQFMTLSSICFVLFEASWQALGVQELRKTIEQRVIHFGYAKMHLVSHISESIQRMGSDHTFTSDISVLLQIGNVKEVYQSINKVNYVQQRLKHTDWCTGLDFMEGPL